MTIEPNIIGISISPLPVADRCCTVCWYSGRKVSAPNSMSPVRKLIADDSVKFRLRNTCNGSTGSAARVSARQNPSAEAAASTARPIITGEPHPYWLPPQVVSSTTAVAASASSAAPR